eukprot:TRINITY_DN2451_c0_g1_i1.p1 TRINITY_DN2451_c0_g1~~TRINITY_DN2451_c0_g1_i1.p1  ORF type:complete len:170 (+),score=23.19 TRINITY_DN2451_c0_g1_i1:57-566(+)
MSSTTVIVGTNKALWKSYTRLTESPKAEEIRPRSILQHAFEELSKCIGEKTYAWISDQLRSMRQDLMVQGIRDDLTVRVYELHLELALQNNDLHSFHTCHAQLEDIYSVGLKGRLFHDVFCMSLIKKSIGGHQFHIQVLYRLFLHISARISLFMIIYLSKHYETRCLLS